MSFQPLTLNQVRKGFLNFSQKMNESWRIITFQCQKIFQPASKSVTSTSSLNASSQFVSTLNKIIKEIENPGCSSNFSQAKKLANKISQLTLPLAVLAQNRCKEELSSEKLLTIYQLAKTLKSTKLLENRIWHELPKEIQFLFEKLFPYAQVPQKGVEYEKFSWILTPSPTSKHVTFSDHLLFRVIPDEQHEGIFILHDYKEYKLYPIAKPASCLMPGVEDAIEEIPLTINDIFDMEELEEQLESYQEYPKMFEEVAPGIKHQMANLQIEYMKMLYESMGVLMDRVLMISPTAEWVIKPKAPLVPIQYMTFKDLSENEISHLAKQLDAYFLAEKCFGIKILESEYHLFCDKFYVRNHSEIYSYPIPFTLKFIDEDIETRHRKILDNLQLNLPNQLVEKLNIQFEGGSTNEKVAKVLSELVDRKYLEPEMLLNFDAFSIEILQVLKDHKEFLNNSSFIEQFRDIQQLRIFLHLLTLKSDEQNSIPDSLNCPNLQKDYEKIGDKVLNLLRNIPCDKQSYSQFKDQVLTFVENDLSLRKDITQMIFKFLLNKEQLDDLINSVNEYVYKNLETEKFQQLCKGIANFKTYIHNILWNQIFEEINTVLFPPEKEGSFEEKMTLLRGLHFSKNQKTVTEKNIRDKLFVCVHEHMKKVEQKKLVKTLRKRIEA